MRLTFLTPEFPGCGPSFGIGRYVESISSGLAERHRVLVLAATDSGFFSIEPGSAPRYVARVPARLALRWPVAAVLAGQANRRFAGQVIEYSNWGALGAGLTAETARVCRLCSPVRSLGGNPAVRIARSLLTWAERRSVLHAEEVIADSLAMAQRSTVEYGRSGSVVHHGLDLPPAPDEPINGQRVLWLGRLEERKGIDVLERAWPLVLRDAPAAELHVVGKDMGGWAERIARLPRTRVHGWMTAEAIADLRRSCGTMVMPSRFESFGLAVLEAWSAGQCVVASDGGSLPELIADGGWCPVAGHAPALAQALVHALNDQGARRERHQAAARRLPCFNAGAVLAGTEAAYDRALQRQRDLQR